MSARARQRGLWHAGLLISTLGCAGSIDEGPPNPSSPGRGNQPGKAGTPMTTGAPGAMAPPGTALPPGTVVPPGTTVPPTTLPPGVVPSAGVPKVTAPSKPTAPLRRLSRLQYNNTIRDLLNDSSRPADAFLSEEVLGTFAGGAALSRVSAASVDHYRAAAEALAAKAVKNLGALVTCKPTDTASEEACARSFIADFGLRAYRRPLTAEDITGKLGVFRKVRVEGDFTFGIQAIIAALLQSPHFLYRAELPPAGAAAGSVVALGPYEIASRLSYFLLNTMPDQALFDAAKANRLGTPAEIEAQARILLKDPRARDTITEFFGQWLVLGSLDAQSKDAKLFPEFNDALKTAMKEETLRFTTSTLLDGDARLETLLTSSRSFINAPLGRLYGVTAGAAFAPMDLMPGQRSGLLTHASILTMTAHSDATSPTRRGLFIRHEFMCQAPPPPPENVDTTPPARKAAQSIRELYQQHATNPVCGACHIMTDPVGFGFENYNPIGKYQTTDGGKPVDAAGEIAASADLDGKFTGAIELSKKLPSSNNVRACMARHWFAFALGRKDAVGDEVSIRSAFDAFAPAGDLRELVVATTKADSFRFRVVEVP